MPPGHIARRKLISVRALVLTRALLEDIHAHVVRQHPIEACGFLAGRFEQTDARAERCIAVSNIAAAADRFVLDPAEYRRLGEDLHSGEELVGFFHSHADDPDPSGLDEVNMRFLPLVWLIVGGPGTAAAGGREMAAFKSHRKEVLRVDLRIERGGHA
jgi:[CysO sulfur-carrier protein]-S-L-cysteine hydrolase